MMEFTKKTVARWMTANASECTDNDGEVSSTSIAEQAAGAFEQNDVGGPLDDGTHWIWDLAAEHGQQA